MVVLNYQNSVILNFPQILHYRYEMADLRQTSWHSPKILAVRTIQFPTGLFLNHIMHRHSCPWNKRTMSSNRNDAATSLLEAQTFFSDDQGVSLELVFNLPNNKTVVAPSTPIKGFSINIHGPWQGTRWSLPKSLSPFFTVPPRCAMWSGNLNIQHGEGSVSPTTFSILF